MMLPRSLSLRVLLNSSSNWRGPPKQATMTIKLRLREPGMMIFDGGGGGMGSNHRLVLFTHALCLLSYPANWYRPSLDDCPCVPNSRWLLGDLALPSCGKLALDLIKAAQDQGEAFCSSPRSGSSIISWANALPSTARRLA